MEKNTEQLIEHCLKHLETERVVVVESLERANALRKALRERDDNALEQSSQHLGVIEQQGRDMVQARDSLTQQIAFFFGVPQQDATIGLVIRNVKGAEQSALARLRKEVKELAETLDTINRGNAALSSQLSNLITRSVETLTGTTSVSRYERTGRMGRPNDVSSIFQADI